MSRYKKKPRQHGEVELNMAAMLDMAFQLLAFFILTFRPSAVESQVSLRMPPAKATDSGGATLKIDDPTPEPLGEQLTMSVVCTADGEISRITIGSDSVSGQQPLDQVLANLNGMLAQKLARGAFDGIALQASSNLIYERLMQVVDVCTRQTLSTGEPLTKISISETGSGQ